MLLVLLMLSWILFTDIQTDICCCWFDIQEEWSENLLSLIGSNSSCYKRTSEGVRPYLLRTGLINHCIYFRTLCASHICILRLWIKYKTLFRERKRKERPSDRLFYEDKQFWSGKTYFSLLKYFTSAEVNIWLMLLGRKLLK